MTINAFHHDSHQTSPHRHIASSGQRLTGVKLIQEHDGSAQDDWLVRYSYSAAGDLVAVRHRHGEVVREFAWGNHLLTVHRVPGGQETHYTWDTPTPEGREERYHFVGKGPGQRWTAHTRADGSRIEFRYDRAGRKVATVAPSATRR